MDNIIVVEQIKRRGIRHLFCFLLFLVGLILHAKKEKFSRPTGTTFGDVQITHHP
jgi:hypothetical protein